MCEKQQQTTTTMKRTTSARTRRKWTSHPIWTRARAWWASRATCRAWRRRWRAAWSAPGRQSSRRAARRVCSWCRRSWGRAPTRATSCSRRARSWSIWRCWRRRPARSAQTHTRTSRPVPRARCWLWTLTPVWPQMSSSDAARFPDSPRLLLLLATNEGWTCWCCCFSLLLFASLGFDELLLDHARVCLAFDNKKSKWKLQIVNDSSVFCFVLFLFLLTFLASRSPRFLVIVVLGVFFYGDNDDDDNDVTSFLHSSRLWNMLSNRIYIILQGSNNNNKTKQKNER